MGLISASPISNTEDRNILRDKFAMAALTGIIAAREGVNSAAFCWEANEVAEDAYDLADAMLKAREAK